MTSIFTLAILFTSLQFSHQATLRNCSGAAYDLPRVNCVFFTDIRVETANDDFEERILPSDESIQSIHVGFDDVFNFDYSDHDRRKREIEDIDEKDGEIFSDGPGTSLNILSLPMTTAVETEEENEEAEVADKEKSQVDVSSTVDKNNEAISVEDVENDAVDSSGEKVSPDAVGVSNIGETTSGAESSADKSEIVPEDIHAGTESEKIAVAVEDEVAESADTVERINHLADEPKDSVEYDEDVSEIEETTSSRTAGESDIASEVIHDGTGSEKIAVVVEDVVTEPADTVDASNNLDDADSAENDEDVSKSKETENSGIAGESSSPPPEVPEFSHDNIEPEKIALVVEDVVTEPADTVDASNNLDDADSAENDEDVSKSEETENSGIADESSSPPPEVPEFSHDNIEPEKVAVVVEDVVTGPDTEEEVTEDTIKIVGDVDSAENDEDVSKIDETESNDTKDESELVPEVIHEDVAPETIANVDNVGYLKSIDDGEDEKDSLEKNSGNESEETEDSDKEVESVDSQSNGALGQLNQDKNEETVESVSAVDKNKEDDEDEEDEDDYGDKEETKVSEIPNFVPVENTSEFHISVVDDTSVERSEKGDVNEGANSISVPEVSSSNNADSSGDDSDDEGSPTEQPPYRSTPDSEAASRVRGLEFGDNSKNPPEDILDEGPISIDNSPDDSNVNDEDDESPIPAPTENVSEIESPVIVESRKVLGTGISLGGRDPKMVSILDEENGSGSGSSDSDEDSDESSDFPSLAGGFVNMRSGPPNTDSKALDNETGAPPHDGGSDETEVSAVPDLTAQGTKVVEPIEEKENGEGGGDESKDGNGGNGDEREASQDLVNTKTLGISSETGSKKTLDGVNEIGVKNDEKAESTPLDRTSTSSGSFVVLGAIVATIIALLGYTVIKSHRQKIQQRRLRAKPNVEEPGTELKERETLLANGKAPNGNVGGEGDGLLSSKVDYEDIPLSKTPFPAERPHYPSNGFAADTEVVASSPKQDKKIENELSEVTIEKEPPIFAKVSNGITAAHPTATPPSDSDNGSAGNPNERGSWVYGNNAPIQAAKIKMFVDHDSVPKTPILVVNRGEIAVEM